MKIFLTVLLFMPVLALAANKPKLEIQNFCGLDDSVLANGIFSKSEIQNFCALDPGDPDMPFLPYMSEVQSEAENSLMKLIRRQAKGAALDFCMNDVAAEYQGDCMDVVGSALFVDVDAFELCKTQPLYDRVGCLPVIVNKSYTVSSIDECSEEELSHSQIKKCLARNGSVVDSFMGRWNHGKHYAANDDEEAPVFIEPRPELIQPCSSDGLDDGPGSGGGSSSGGGGISSFGGDYDGPCFF